MDANPDEVVTLLLVNSDGVYARELEGVYSEADIAHYGYIAPTMDKAPLPSNETHAAWPTLDEMIAKDQRLVSFINPIEPDKQNAPYLLNEFDFVWENKYDVTNPVNFTCAPDRPANQNIADVHDSRRLFTMNHFLYWQQAFGIEVPDVRNVSRINAWEGPGALGVHMRDRSSQLTRQPTFVLVDFFNVGPAIETVDIFNEVKQPVGRFEVTNKVVEGGAGFVRSRTKKSIKASNRAVILAVVMGLPGSALV